MTKIYKLEDRYNKPALRYRYGDDGIDYSKRLVEPSDDGCHFLRTEQDVIHAWADYAKQSLVGEYRESDQRCWVGHYEQFGMVMLTLGRISRYRKDYRGLVNPYLEAKIPRHTYPDIFIGPWSSECRIYYRSWFSLVGHPDFLGSDVLSPESIKYKETEFLLSIAVQEFHMGLGSLKD
jgi:hypothetical protein